MAITTQNKMVMQSFNGNGATAMDRRGREKLGGASAWNQICQTCCMLHVRIHVKLVVRSKSCQWSIPWLLPGLHAGPTKARSAVHLMLACVWYPCRPKGRFAKCRRKGTFWMWFNSFNVKSFQTPLCRVDGSFTWPVAVCRHKGTFWMLFNVKMLPNTIVQGPWKLHLACGCLAPQRHVLDVI